VKGTDSSKISRRTFLKSALVCSAGLGYWYPWEYDVNNIELNTVYIPIKNLDQAFDGFTITQISDLHCDRSSSVVRLEHAVDIVNQQRSDLVVVTGDYFTNDDGASRHMRDCGKLLSSIKSKEGVVSVTGNHDYWTDFNVLSKMIANAGVRLLDNVNFFIQRRGAYIQIIGLSSFWMGEMNTVKAFSGVINAPKIVLAHNPDTAPHITKYFPDIMICGHTHGGQVRFPILGPIISYTRIGRKYSSGLNKYGDMMIYTNRGIGTYWIDARFLCPPEITTFVLKTAVS